MYIADYAPNKRVFLLFYFKIIKIHIFLLKKIKIIKKKEKIGSKTVEKRQLQYLVGVLSVNCPHEYSLTEEYV